MNTEIKEIIKEISALVKFPSYQQPAIEGMPFGKDAYDCLEYFLALAKSFGFEVKNYDGYAGEVIWGEGEEFAVLAHLDVVTAGNGWTKEPFGGEIDEVNKKVWGRGTMDDKGPAVISLFAMKALKDAGYAPTKRVKLIVGCNEETGWACIDYYKSHAHMPDVGFSPDANFPVIYAEKGIVHVELEFKAQGFTGLKGGELDNMVCDYCEVNTEYTDEAIKLGLTLENGKVVSRGKSAHGSTPDEGINAIAPVLKFLKLDGAHRLLFEDGFGLKQLKDETGHLTFSPNVIKQDKNRIFVTCDIRYPPEYALTNVISAFEKEGVPYKIKHAQEPLRGDKNSTLIRTLASVYGEVTGKDCTPVAIGGGTYARALKCGAAFGPEEDGEECTVHQANEYITFEKIEKCFEIYKLALKKLVCG